MTTSPTAVQVLERHYLELRCKILDIAATLDRIDRGPGGALTDDLRLRKIHAGLEILQGPSATRAEQVQILFSDTYDPDWRK